MKAYVFACDGDTMDECLKRQLFGVGKPYVSDISPGDLCYLYNFDNKLLYGVWEATSRCAIHEPRAWGGRFRHQVKVQLTSESLQAVPIRDQRLVNPHDERTWTLWGEKAGKLLTYFSSTSASEYEAGSRFSDLEEDYRNRYPATYKCDDNHMVRSSQELTIDNWFNYHGIHHIYEPVVAIPEGLIPDFRVYTKEGQPVYIEFWGMLGEATYQNHMRKKQQVYANRQMKVIELRPSDLHNLDHILTRRLMQHDVILPR